MKTKNLKLAHHSISSTRGFTLFFAVLVSGIILTIGMAIFNISFKELILSSSIRDSQFAFYAADSGIECVLYWDLKHNAFNPASSSRSISCNGQSFTVGGAAISIIDHIQFNPEPYCAEITVTKTPNATGFDTLIESRGYNACDSTSDRIVERGIVVTY